MWQERFKLLAKAPLKRVTIVDRYAVSQHRECPQGRLSGLERFLRLLDADASGKRYVSLFSAWTGELKGVCLEEVQKEVETVLRRLQQDKVKEVRIVMLPNHVFGDLHHDRFIRFEDYVWDIGLGIKVFEGPATTEISTVAFKAADQVASYREAERGLGSHPEARFIKARR